MDECKVEFDKWSKKNMAAMALLGKDYLDEEDLEEFESSQFKCELYERYFISWKACWEFLNK